MANTQSDTLASRKSDGATSGTLAVKALHDELYAEVMARAEQRPVDASWAEEFKQRFKLLEERFREYAGQVTSEDQFNWLRKATRDWDEVLLNVFSQSSNMRQSIGISVPPKGLEPAYHPLSDEEAREYLATRACNISRSRKLTQLFQRWEELNSSPERIDREIPSKLDEQKQDWYWATVCFASEVLDGRIGFAHRVGEDLYPTLEEVWLADVKQWNAYHVWASEGRHWQPDGGKWYYYKAAHRLHMAALTDTLKASSYSFRRVEQYIDQMYLANGKIDVNREPGARKLIEAKAYRRWEYRDREGLSGTASDDWRTARSYVGKFYDHIIPSIRGEEEDIRQVAQLLYSCHEDGTPCDLVNCFEAALVIYYVDPTKLKSACGAKSDLLF